MEKILILDFGSQYTQLIARRVRELNVYCEIHPFNKIPAIDASVRGVILSGSPFSVRDAQAPTPDLSAIKGKLPLLGVCYGAQFLASAFGGEVQPAPSREYGRAMLTVGDASDALMRGLPARTQVWMSHGDTITRVPDNYELIASTEDVRVAAFHVGGEQTWGIQFHPEVYHSTDGTQLLKNFVVDICGCGQSWTSEGFVEATVRELREKLGDDKVVLALSGGVDSSVAAVLLHKAIGKNLYCVFVDSGLLRKNEFGEVLESYKHMGLNVKGVNASAKFLGDLAGVTDPERKRKIIGRDFVEVFNEEAIQIKDVKWLAQGTIYPDVIESCSVNGPSATIKSHHNVGGLPEKMNLKIVEPLPAVQGRGAPRGPFDGHFRTADRPPSLPGTGPCDPHSGRHHAREGRNPPERRQNLYRLAARRRAVRPGVAGGGCPASGEERRRDGRRAHLRELRGPARRDLHGRHDGRLGAPALRVPGQRVERHHQQGQGGQPRSLRHLLQTARNHRVGVGGFPL